MAGTPAKPVGGPFPMTLAGILNMHALNDDPFKNFADSVGVLNSSTGSGGASVPF